MPSIPRAISVLDSLPWLRAFGTMASPTELEYGGFPSSHLCSEGWPAQPSTTLEFATSCALLELRKVLRSRDLACNVWFTAVSNQESPYNVQTLFLPLEG